MTEYILNPGDIITVGGDNPLVGCLGVLMLGFIGLAVIDGLGIAISNGYRDKKPESIHQLQVNPEIQQGIEYNQEYIIDPYKINDSPNTNSQLENIIDPEAISATFLLKKIEEYQAIKIGGYNFLSKDYA